MRVFLVAVLAIIAFSQSSFAVIRIPLNGVTCSRADTLLQLPINNLSWKEDQLLQRDSSAALHPDAFWAGSPILGYRGWLTYSPIAVSEGDENPHIVVTNDPGLRHWGEFVCGPDTLHNPIFDTSDFHAAHLSDQDIVLDTITGTPVLGFRVCWGIARTDSTALYISQTRTGLSWDTTCVLRSSASAFISPAWIGELSGGHALYCVEQAAVRDGRENRIVRYTASSLAGSYVFDDTCRLIWGTNIDSTLWDIWHLNVFRYGDQLLMDATLCPEDSTGGRSDSAGSTTVQVLLESFDNGRSWIMADSPHLSTRTVAGKVDSCSFWDAAGTYRAAVVPQQIGDCNRFAYLYTGRLWNGCSEGNFSRKWGIGLTELRFEGIDTTDIDADGVTDCFDNCPIVSNPHQDDADGDLIGNACDCCPDDRSNDVDNDGVCGLIDNCPLAANTDQNDNDRDGIGNACDNCPDAPDATQIDTDSDGIGDACCCVIRGDITGDNQVLVNDLNLLVKRLFSGSPASGCPAHADINGDTRVNVADLSSLLGFLFRDGYPPHVCP